MDPLTPSISSGGLEDGFEYLSEPNENLICPICRNPFVDPVMCESNDHVFCRNCLIRSLELSSTCPIDRLPLSLSLVIPAPKIIVKLVDELLVSCPFKSKLDCAFVCQRDLMSAHVRSHQSKHYRPLSIAQHQTCKISTQPHQLCQRLSSRSSSPLRFQWLSGQATLVEDTLSQGSIASEPHKPLDCLATTTVCGSVSLTVEQRSDATSQPLEHCPFEQFGCQFIGTKETITDKHLSAISVPNQLVVSPDPARCPFSFVQDILKSFQNLEGRNSELKQQLSQSLVKQDELTSVIQNLQASFRQLWLSHQPTTTDEPATVCSTLASPLVNSPPVCTTVGKACLPTSDSCAVPRRSSDGSLPLYNSRLNYDTAKGHRLKHFNYHLPSYPRQSQHFSGPSSSSISSTLGQNMRVLTFVRKGEVVTPTTLIHSPVLPLDALNTSFASDRPPHISSRVIHNTSQSESSTSNPLTVKSSFMTPKFIQIIQSIDKHLDNGGDNKHQHEDLPTNSTVHPMQILDNLREIKQLLEDLVDRGIEELEPKKAEQQKEDESNPDPVLSSSSNLSSFKSSTGSSPSNQSSSLATINMTGLVSHTNAHPIDRRNSPHLKL